MWIRELRPRRPPGEEGPGKGGSACLYVRRTYVRNASSTVREQGWKVRYSPIVEPRRAKIDDVWRKAEDHSLRRLPGVLAGALRPGRPRPVSSRCRSRFRWEPALAWLYSCSSAVGCLPTSSGRPPRPGPGRRPPDPRGLPGRHGRAPVRLLGPFGAPVCARLTASSCSAAGVGRTGHPRATPGPGGPVRRAVHHAGCGLPVAGRRGVGRIGGEPVPAAPQPPGRRQYGTKQW